MKKFLKYFGIGLLVIIILAVSGFVLWASNPPAPEPTALDSLGSTPDVSYETRDNWLIFTPTGDAPDTGLVMYPGGRVDYRAYAPHARAIASEGFLVVVVPMPLNFAFLGVNRAADVIDAFPNIEYWAVGGHSLGGAMAAQFTASQTDLVDGLVLWAAYSAQGTDLSDLDLKVVSIYASNDGLASQKEIDDSRSRVPGDTIYVEIMGGNHAGFGWYGPQAGDGSRSISKTEQQDQIVEATTAFLQTVAE